MFVSPGTRSGLLHLTFHVCSKIAAGAARPYLWGTVRETMSRIDTMYHCDLDPSNDVCGIRLTDVL
jgi:hypothetical protein